MTDRTLSALRRRLEKWELEHLRKLAAELADRLDRAEEEAARAWECAESWREDALRLTEELIDEGRTVGLTKAGEIVIVRQAGEETGGAA